MQTAHNLVSFWHGELSWLERMCIASMSVTGHQLTIYSYEPEKAKRSGVQAKFLDAKEIIGTDHPYFTFLNIKPALFSDVMRYELLLRSKGFWVDLDLLFMRQAPHSQELVAAFEHEAKKIVNGAALFMPSDSRLLLELVKFCETRPVMAPWWPLKLKVKHRAWVALSRPIPPEECQWGIFGPKAISHFVRELGMSSQVLPSVSFYPVPWKNADELTDPNAGIERWITSDTYAVHLWANSLRKRLKGGPPHPNSFLGRKARELLGEKHAAANLVLGPT